MKTEVGRNWYFQSIHFYKLSGRQVSFPGPNGHQHILTLSQPVGLVYLSAAKYFLVLSVTASVGVKKSQTLTLMRG
jgi:hypothetical protein